MNGRKRKRARDTVICAACLGASALLIIGGSQDIMNCLEIRSSIAANEKKAAELDQKQADLETARENLDNPDYVEYIARGRYLVSKEGEQVFKFPSIENEDS